MYISWIIPCYNEEHRIEKTVREVNAYLQSKQFGDGYEILISNSASTDHTKDVIERMALELPCLRVLNLENRGKGWAVKQAMLNARGDIRLFSDADNSTDPHYFDAMEPLFHQQYDVVISSRDPKDAPGASRDVKEQWYRELMGNMGNIIIQIFGVWGIWDTQNGFKACTAKFAQTIFSRTRMTGFSFDIEMLALAKKFKFRIGIIPIRWKFDPDSKVTLKSYIQVFIDVFRIRWNLIKGIYPHVK